MKRKIAGVLSLCLLAGALTVPAAAATSREDDVEFVLQMLTKAPGSEYAWNTDGGRESTVHATHERVWGWSTCYDKYGEKASHYTHSRYEDFFGLSRDEWSSGRKWGTGQVWAYSPYIGYNVAGELKARVYYGL